MTEQKSTPEGLKPCRVPWCPATEPYLEETKDHFMFFCQGCGSRTHRHTTLEGALGEWNLPDKVTDRAAAPETAARLEKLEAENAELRREHLTADELKAINDKAEKYGALFKAAERLSSAYASDGNTKRQKAAFAGLRAALKEGE